MAITVQLSIWKPDTSYKLIAISTYLGIFIFFLFWYQSSFFFLKFEWMNCQKFNNTPIFFLQVRGKVQNLTRKLFGIIREWFLLKSCQNQSNFYFYSLVILMFNHSNRMHLFRRNILLRILFLSPFFLWELFRTWRDKTAWTK